LVLSCVRRHDSSPSPPSCVRSDRRARRFPGRNRSTYPPTPPVRSPKNGLEPSGRPSINSPTTTHAPDPVRARTRERLFRCLAARRRRTATHASPWSTRCGSRRTVGRRHVARRPGQLTGPEAAPRRVMSKADGPGRGPPRNNERWVRVGFGWKSTRTKWMASCPCVRTDASAPVCSISFVPTEPRTSSRNRSRRPTHRRCHLRVSWRPYASIPSVAPPQRPRGSPPRSQPARPDGRIGTAGARARTDRAGRPRLPAASGESGV